MHLFLTFLGIPQPKQSFRVAKVGNFIKKFQSAEVVKNERNIKFDCISQLPAGFKPFAGPLRIRKLDYVFPIPKSMSKKMVQFIRDGGIVYKSTKPDLTDNLNKGLFDALEGIVYINDSQIAEVQNSRKIYGETPYISLVIEEII